MLVLTRNLSRYHQEEKEQKKTTLPDPMRLSSGKQLRIPRYFIPLGSAYFGTDLGHGHKRTFCPQLGWRQLAVWYSTTGTAL